MSYVSLADRAVAEARKINPGLSATWQPYIFDAEEVTGGITVTGCETSTFQRGPRKGRTKYLTKQGRMKIFLRNEL